jgi:hypothetical protein
MPMRTRPPEISILPSKRRAEKFSDVNPERKRGGR